MGLEFYACLLASFVLGSLRVLGFKSLFFQGVAHVFVGYLFGRGLPDYRPFLFLGIALTVLEVFCAFFLRNHQLVPFG